MDGDPRLLAIFLDVQRGLPRQGPGCDASTLEALSLCAGLPDRPRVLDLGCGPGMQTVALARALAGPVAALDVQRESLRELTARAGAAGVAERITAIAADMTAPPFPDATFDLVWSEGAAYVMGFARALVAWRRLLKPAGRLAVSELVWLRPDPPAEVAGFFRRAYPAMADVPKILTTFRNNGLEVLGHFTLPDAAWWDPYYAPLDAKLPALRDKYAGDERALDLLHRTEREIAMRRRFREWYGYGFFVGRRAG